LPFAVIGWGVSAARAQHASDLDLLFVYDGKDAADFAPPRRSPSS
jgi:hypothetical protein